MMPQTSLLLSCYFPCTSGVHLPAPCLFLYLNSISSASQAWLTAAKSAQLTNKKKGGAKNKYVIHRYRTLVLPVYTCWLVRTDDCLILNFNFPISIMKALLMSTSHKIVSKSTKIYNIEDQQFHQIFHQFFLIYSLLSLSFPFTLSQVNITSFYSTSYPLCLLGKCFFLNSTPLLYSYPFSLRFKGASPDSWTLNCDTTQRWLGLGQMGHFDIRLDQLHILLVGR